jgi:hypothetical protein
MAPVLVLTGHGGPPPHTMRFVPAIVAMSIQCFFSSMCWLIYSSGLVLLEPLQGIYVTHILIFLLFQTRIFFETYPAHW